MRNPSKAREWVYSSKWCCGLLLQTHLSENCSALKGEEMFPVPLPPTSFMWHWCVLKCMGKVCSLFPPKGPSPPGILMNKLIRIKSIMRITNDTNLQICWQLWPYPSSHLLVARWTDQVKEFPSRSFTAHELRVQPCEIISQQDYKAVIRQGSSGGPGHETVNCPRETWSHPEGSADIPGCRDHFISPYLFILAGVGDTRACTQTRAVPSSAWRPLEMNRNQIETLVSSEC